jgi:[acyl-carrier-protein] S-malonyltransferase
MAGYGYLFPGQGSQQPGMGKDFLDKHALARELFDEANTALGFDLKALCLEGPEDQLALTYHAQPAILTVSTIAYRLFAERAPATPLSVAGHSLGEYSALVAARAVPFAKAVHAVHLRGKAMQEATPVGVGAMAAILGADAAELEAICQEESKGQIVVPANYNCTGQIVISGHAEAVDRVLARTKGKRLTVSAPFHSPLMAPAAEAMRPVIEALAWSDAVAPVCANASNRFLSKPAEFPPSLLEQITAPVRWDSGVQAMIAGGVTGVIEFGHGKVLGGLMKRIDKSVPAINVQDDESLSATLAQVAG